LNKKLIDITERVAATAVEAALAYGITQIADIKAAWVMPLTAALSLGKSWISTWLGNKNSAAMLPAAKDNAA